MANLPPYPDSTDDDTGLGSNRESPPGTPRWVKVFGIIAILLILLFVVLHLSGNRFQNHTFSGGTGDHTPPIEHGVQQP
jgi:hypothetical protein